MTASEARGEPKANGVTTAGPRTGVDRKTWTVLELLRWTTEHFTTKGIETARLDAELLLAFVLGVDRLRLYLDFDKPVVDEERARFRALVRRRGEERVPVAYLTGVREFWSLPIAVTPDVLIPRPDTETLVEAVLSRAPRREAPLAVLDVGSGSGAIALALASEWPAALFTVSDVSDVALALARKNAETLGFGERFRFAAGDLLDAVPGERFDVIVSNPPYVAEADAAALAPELRHEPATALFTPGDGTALLRRIAAAAPAHLRPGGLLALELAPAQAGDVTQCLREVGFGALAEHRDLTGRVRAVSATRPGGE